MKQLFYLKALVVFFISAFILSASAQSTNPFEIRSRLDSVANLPELDIPESPAFQASPDTLTSAAGIDVDTLNTIPQNPFEVDHLPLRKSAQAQPVPENNLPQTESGSQNQSNTFIFWILLVTAALLAIVINLNFTTIKMVFRSLFNMNLFKLFHREEGTMLTVSQLFLYIIFFTNIGVLVYLFLNHRGDGNGWKFWMVISGAIALFYFVKHLLVYLIGQVFEIQKPTSLYNFSIQSYHIFSGIILLPINLTAAFAPGWISQFLLYTAFLFIAFIIVLKVVRGLIISLDFWGDRFFQFFVYLCAFEILPVLILVKFLLYQVNP